jgi:hypothetical protein
MRDASQDLDREGFACAACGRFNITAVEGLFDRNRAGSAQRFCDHACRQAAYRRRRAGVPEDAPLQQRGGRNRRLNPTTVPSNAHPIIPKPHAATQGEAV